MGRPRKNLHQSSSTFKKVQSLPGLSDVLADSDQLWSAVTRRFARVARTYGFERVETPLLENKILYENFYRNFSKMPEQLLEMPLEGMNLAVRPAFLPSILRAYIQHKIFDKSPMNKWYYAGMVARKSSQKDSLSGDYEFGLEILGSFTHLTEAQTIAAAWELLESLGVKGVTLEINNIGGSDCQALYQETLADFLSGKKYELCDDCNDHLRSRALNVFRCQNLDCQAIASESPTILDFLDQDSHKRFTNVLEALDELAIPYQLNPQYAGPDGFSHTNMVIKFKDGDKTIVIGEAGYHDSLMQNVAGKRLCAFGFSGSLTALRHLMERQKIEPTRERHNDVFLVPLGELASKKSLRLFRDLTSEKISVYDHFGQSGVKNQLKQAQEFHAPIALIMGQKEALDEMVILRDVKSGMQEIISYDKIVAEVKKRLGR